jgi:hypothetical protein
LKVGGVKLKKNEKERVLQLKKVFSLLLIFGWFVDFAFQR